MTVGELIKELQRFEPEMPAMVQGYESGYDEIKEIRIITGLSYYPKQDNNWYDGEYQEVRSIDIQSDGISAVYLPRSS